MPDLDGLIQSLARENMEVRRLRIEREHLLSLLQWSRNLDLPLVYEEGKSYMVLGRSLSAIEYGVLQGIMRGWTAKRISEETRRSDSAVKEGFSRIYAKLGIPHGKTARMTLMATIYQETARLLAKTMKELEECSSTSAVSRPTRPPATSSAPRHDARDQAGRWSRSGRR